MVKDIATGDASSSPAGLTAVNSTLFLAANDGIVGSELWKSDGTAAGTVLVKDITSGAGSSSPAFLTNVAGTLSGDGLARWKLGDQVEVVAVRVERGDLALLAPHAIERVVVVKTDVGDLVGTEQGDTSIGQGRLAGA